MAEENKKINEQGSDKKKQVETKKVEKAKAPVKTETKKTEAKTDKAVGDKKAVVKKDVKKDRAVAFGRSLRISPKHSVAICKVLLRKSPDRAVQRLEAVLSKRRVIPMAGLEVAHQKGKGVSGAKYPFNACRAFIPLIKQVGANASVVGIDNPVIVKAVANRAPAPFKSHGRRAKRTHVMLEVVDKSKLLEARKK